MIDIATTIKYAIIAEQLFEHRQYIGILGNIAMNVTVVPLFKYVYDKSSKCKCGVCKYSRERGLPEEHS